MPEIALRQYENEIDHLIEEARYLEALAHTRHILRQYPRYIGAYYLLGKTMLEADQPELAIDMFQRALHADPEHLMARIGLTLAHQRVDNLDAAIWNLERAIELNPGDEDLLDELRQLCGRRDGFEPKRIPLNRAGLARLYMRGNRPGRAVEELHTLLAEKPQRLDLRLALAEAYWRDDQIVQAADTCQTLLDDARYCLKANLLLGALWVDSGQEEGQTYLNRAQEIDIENTLANELFGAASPLKPRQVSIEHLTYRPDTLDVDQQAKWFRQLEAASVSVSPAAMQPELTESEARLVDITAGLEAQIEIPDWLRELGDGENSALSWMADISAEAEAAEAKAVAEPATEAQAPAWLREEEEEVEEIPVEEELPEWLRTATSEEAAPEAAGEGLELAESGVTDAGAPDWLSELETTTPAEEAPGGEGIPAWLQALQPAAPAEEISMPAEGMPDWLSELKRPGEAEEEVAVAPAEEALDWLQSLEPAAPAEEETEAVEVGEELPDWMEDFAGVGETAEEGLAVEEGALPDWLTEFQPEETAAAEAPVVVPTEEAGLPDWLAELEPAKVHIEATEPETGIPDWLSELEPAAGIAVEAETEEDLLDWLGEIPVAEGVEGTVLTEETASTIEEAPVAEGFFGWEAFGEEITEVEVAHSEVTQIVAEEVSAPMPDLEGEELSGDDALAWLSSLAAGKEDELRAQAEAGTQARVAEILGHKPAAKPAKPEPVVEEPAVVAEEAPTVADFFAPEGEAAPVEIAESEFDWESLAEQLDESEGEVAAASPVAEGDDALAWLESLDTSSGVDEFFAEAETESEAAEPEPTVEATAEALEEGLGGEGFFGWEAFGEEITEIAAPAAEGDFMSGDDALAWLESLTVGKEEELRAQAEIETQARVAEILGHKPAAKRVEPEPVVEEPAVVLEEPPTVEGFFGWEAFGEEITEVEATAPETTAVVSASAETVAESAPAESAPASAAVGAEESDLLSGDDALAWLSSLAAGKEDELRAQAEASTQARVAEILGRRPEPRTPEPVAKEPVVEEPVREAHGAPEVAATVGAESVTAGSVTVEEITVEVPAAEGDMMSGDDALAWLSSLAAGKEDELRAQAEASTQARVAEILGRKPEPKAAAPEEWRAPEAPARVVAEAIPPEVVVTEAPEPVVEAPKVEPEAAPEEEVLVEIEPGEEAEYTGELSQARAAWKAGNVDAALEHYSKLIQAEAGLEDVINDLKKVIAERPDNATLYQVLGDAYMANGLIDQAIETYNRAISFL